jgi:hypothetical protein
MGASIADKNRNIRKEALREQLSNGKHVQHVIEISNKLNDSYLELESANIAALKASADIKLKLINKYLPDLKAVEMTGPDGKDLIPAAIKVIYE